LRGQEALEPGGIDGLATLGAALLCQYMAQIIAAPHIVIFDVDGTLIDSVDQHARAWVAAFSDYGHRVPFDAVRRQIGKGGDQLMPMFLSASAIAQYGDELETHRARILKERYLPTIKAFPQVRPLLERVRAAGKRVALASSAKADELAAYEKIANIADLIDAETSSDDADRSKPCPDIFEAALRRFEVEDPGHAIAVGDTPYDAEAAAAAGIRTIGLLCGGWTENELREAGCIAVYRDAADLLARFAESALAAGPASRLR
jgi:HAD superfamily hydrolase (TIGR01509 family)